MFQGVGWAQIKEAAAYAGVSTRTLRAWLRRGLPFVRVPHGCILIKVADINVWLEGFKESTNEVNQLVEDALEPFMQGKKQ